MPMTGAVQRTQTLSRGMTAAVSFGGEATAIVRIAAAIAGVLSAEGDVTRAVFYGRTAEGGIIPAAVLTRFPHFKRLVDGVVSAAGAVTFLTGQMVNGVLSFAGSVARKAKYKLSAAGTLTSTGGVTGWAWARIVRNLAGVLTIRGTALRLGGAIKRGLSRMGFNFKS